VNNKIMPLNNAVINIRNLRLRTYIGFNPEEKEKKQDVIINIEINYAINNAVLEDSVDNALDYKQVTKQVIEHVENGRFLLLEKLVADVLNICSKNSVVSYARVTIDKPHALRFADSVSLALEYVSNKTNTLKLVENMS
jgi:D-erythro-7,8-dihydroneopterin triphosphate epimerase